jgi:hypothetical protein
MQIHSMMNNAGSWSIGTRIDDMLESCGSLCEDNDILLGDLNFDGIHNVQDIITIINFVLGNSTPSDDEFTAADMNVDGIINILDVIEVVNIILGSDDLARTVKWLEKNFPELETKKRLEKLQEHKYEVVN